MDAMLMLEDGTLHQGHSFTGPGEAFGELVFNTGLTGYQEVISDPSYAGQIVLLTAPMIGTYGIRRREEESARVWTEGLVVREYGGRPLSEAFFRLTEGALRPEGGRSVFARPSYDPQGPARRLRPVQPGHRQPGRLPGRQPRAGGGGRGHPGPDPPHPGQGRHALG
jgi:hypothetical protein